MSELHRATARLGSLYAHGRTPDPDAELAARRDLAYLKIRREIDNATCATLHPVQVGHLVALLVGGSDPEAVERFSRAVAEAAFSLPGLTADDRTRIAAQLVGSDPQ